MTRTDSGPTTTIFIEGKILGPWVAEIRSTIDAIPTDRARKLDLGAVTFVDAAGAALLAVLMRDGVEITSCSHFLTDLLDQYSRNLPR